MLQLWRVCRQGGALESARDAESDFPAVPHAESEKALLLRKGGASDDSDSEGDSNSVVPEPEPLPEEPPNGGSVVNDSKPQLASAEPAHAAAPVGLGTALPVTAGAPPTPTGSAAPATVLPAAQQAAPNAAVAPLAAVEGDDAACPAAGEEDTKTVSEAMDFAFLRGEREVTDSERVLLKGSMTEMFRNRYRAIRAELEAARAKKSADEVDVVSALQTAQYANSSGLKLTGGHRPMARPEGVPLPNGFREEVGILDLEELSAYSSSSAEGRLLLSVYGSIFDVSDRPDKYGADGPYHELTGRDITWGLFCGVDTADYTNKCYDLFKATALGEDSLKRKLAGICSWLAWYEIEYGAPVGHLDIYIEENELPAPPLEEINDCSIV